MEHANDQLDKRRKFSESVLSGVYSGVIGLDKDLKINLSSIGKGFGIDLIGKKLNHLGIKNYLINIGGDILTKGHNKKKENWIFLNNSIDSKIFDDILDFSRLKTNIKFVHFDDINNLNFQLHVLN